jgi:hypothetical protein
MIRKASLLGAAALTALIGLWSTAGLLLLSEFRSGVAEISLMVSDHHVNIPVYKLPTPISVSIIVASALLSGVFAWKFFRS